MDLVTYEPVPLSNLQDQFLSSAANALRDVQDQAAAWLRRVALTVAPGLADREGEREESGD